MDAEEQALLRAIVDDCDSDEQRLVYADWLEDHAGPSRLDARLAHAHLIRSQVRGPGSREARADERRLLDDIRAAGHRHCGHWLSTLHAADGGTAMLLADYQRGFPDSLLIMGGRYAEAAPGSLQRAFTSVMSCCPVTHLQIAHATDDDVCWLAAQPSLRRVRRLDLAGCPLGRRAVEALSRCPHLQGLRHLDLRSCRLSDDDARAVAESPYLRDLQSLRLGKNLIGDAGALAIGASSQLRNLEALDLSENQVSLEALEAIAGSPSLPKLRDLAWHGDAVARAEHGRYHLFRSRLSERARAAGAGR